MKRAWFAPWRRDRPAPAGSGAEYPEYPEPVCREAVELVTAYLDDILEPGPRAALERHLANCPHCSEYFAQIRSVREAAGLVEPEELAPQTRQGLMDLYLQWRATDAADTAAAASFADTEDADTGSVPES